MTQGDRKMEQTLQNVLTEKDLQDLLGMNKDQISGLRRKGLPFVKLTERHRLYFEHDLIDYFQKKRVLLNQHE